MDRPRIKDYAKEYVIKESWLWDYAEAQNEYIDQLERRFCMMYTSCSPTVSLPDVIHSQYKSIGREEDGSFNIPPAPKPRIDKNTDG